VNNVAVIPARGGSKRIPRKNIKPFAGKPLIAYAIEAAKASGIFSDVVVSTDDEEISKVAQGYGASVPFMRPPALSDDYAGTTEVIAHATTELERSSHFDAVCCIYASPFVRAEDLIEASQVLGSANWDYVFAATAFRAPIFRAFKALPDGGVEMFFPDKFSARSQDLPVALHDAGQFYFGRPQAWKEQRSIYGARSYAMLMPAWRVQDIDTEEDWARAELMWRASVQS
jgi:pseudaminic acid cytidylyltransferase